MFYEVLATVRHGETLETMAHDHPLCGEHALWVRPAAMFNEEFAVLVDHLNHRLKLDITKFGNLESKFFYSLQNTFKDFEPN